MCTNWVGHLEICDLEISWFVLRTLEELHLERYLSEMIKAMYPATEVPVLQIVMRPRGKRLIG